MQQLTREQAIKIKDSDVWRQWSDEQLVRVQLFQERLCVDFGTFQNALNRCLNRPVFTHEFGMRSLASIQQEFLAGKPAPTTDELRALASIFNGTDNHEPLD